MERYADDIQRAFSLLKTDLYDIKPELCLALTFLLITICGLFSRKEIKYVLPGLGLSGLVLTLYLTVEQFQIPAHPLGESLFFGMLLLDGTAIVFKLIFTAISLFVFLFAWNDQELRHIEKGRNEFYALLLVINLGLNLMAMAGNLMMAYIGLEMVSVCSYILTAYVTENKQSAEAGIKYALFGAFASAVMLYGMSLLYGITGTLQLFNEQFLNAIQNSDPYILNTVILLISAGLFFKIAVFPMHFWSPDVYQGTSLPVVSFLSIASKAAGFALLFRFLDACLPMMYPWQITVILIGIATMCIGNFSALKQTNLKRFMAYSSIGHSGFLMMGVIAYGLAGASSVLFYLIAYAIATMGAFMSIGYFVNMGDIRTLSDLRGLGKKSPLVGICFIIFLISLIGIPPTVGFFGKFILFSDAIKIYLSSGNGWLLTFIVLAVINTVVSLFYYFKIPLHLFLREGNKNVAQGKGNPVYMALILILALLTVILGLTPHWLINEIQPFSRY